MATPSTPLATVAVISIGDMGAGIAKLLLANDFRVITNITGRSEATQERAKKHSIETFDTDEELCSTADFVLSIVPPRDALVTAQRIATAFGAENNKTRKAYYLELNAISPATSRSVATIFQSWVPQIKYIDGGIIGGPPQLNQDKWLVPKIATSGPDRLDTAEPNGKLLAKVLNIQHVNDNIGSASGLKMCFASLSKGFTALAIQSYTTAHNLGVLPELKEYLEAINPRALESAERSLPGMAPKAYRWVREMEEIANTFHVDGGFNADENVFGAIARVYGLVADGTDLGLEQTDRRKRGKTADDIALLMSEGLVRRKVKED